MTPAIGGRVVAVRELAAGFDKCAWEHVPRAQNAAADKLANEALDEKAGKA